MQVPGGEVGEIWQRRQSVYFQMVNQFTITEKWEMAEVQYSSLCLSTKFQCGCFLITISHVLLQYLAVVSQS